jgi:large-conductance mechanosensitive channel
MENSSFGRLFGVLFAPGKTFRSIAERPTWVVPLLVLAILGMAMGLVINQRIDQREMISRQMEKFGQQMTEEQLDEAVERAENPSPLMRTLSIVGGFIGHCVIFLLIAFLFWLIFKLTGSEMTYKSSLSTYLHAAVPMGISFLLTIPVVLSRSSIGPEVMTEGALASSPAAFMPEGTSALVKAALSGLDFFGLWVLALSIIGYRTVARVSTTMAVTAAVLIWLLGLGMRLGFAALFG